MAASAFLRKPWVVSLTMKATMNGRLRPQGSRNSASGAATCSGRMSALISTHYYNFDSRNTARVGAVRSASRGVSSIDQASLDMDVSRKVAGGVDEDVVEREVLSREDWTARAEAHRQR